MANSGSEKRVLVSYLTLRRLVGVLGVVLPVSLALLGFRLCGCWELRASISDYYGLRTRDVLVGVLFTIAWFLYTYRGYDRRDNRAGNLACLFALGVALFPNSGEDWEKAVHFLSGFGLFMVLAYFSLVLFTKSGSSPTPQKRIRNKVYVACGLIILTCIALVGVYYWLWAGSSIAAIKPVFWLESVALWAFGFAWFVKGDTLWKDTRRKR